jgi:hypothetical protein
MLLLLCRVELPLACAFLQQKTKQKT